MRRIANRLLTAAAGIFAATAAFAADMPVYQAAPAPVAAYGWTGLYVNAFFGFAVNPTNEQVAGRTPPTTTTTTTAPTAWTKAVTTTTTIPGNTLAGTVSGESKGVLGGVELGYDYQFFPTLVFGLFGEGALADINGGGGLSAPPILVTATNATNYLMAFGGRLGYLVTPATLVFVKGAFAGGGAHPNFSAGVTESIHDTSIGWMAGAGVEYRINQNWFMRVDYEHYQLGDETLNISLPSGVIATNTAHYRFEVTKVGLGYHF